MVSRCLPKTSVVLLAAAVVCSVVACAARADEAAAPPRLVSPADGASISAISAQFRWQHDDDQQLFVLQIARDANFSQLADQTEPFAIAGDAKYAHYSPGLAPGAYFWRVRRADGPWSASRRLVILPPGEPQPPVVDLAKAGPVFLFYVRPNEVGNFRRPFPSGLRPHVAFGGGLLDKREELSEWRAPSAGQDDAFPWITLNPSTADCGLPEMEWAFRHCPNVIGVSYAEFQRELQTRPWEREHFMALVKLCARYGRYVMWADGISGDDPWEMFAGEPQYRDLLQKYGRYVVLGHKSNIHGNAWISQAEVLGMWLDGLIGAQLEHVETWYWRDVGFKEHLGYFYGRQSPALKTGGDGRAMPPGMHLQQWTVALSRGVAVYTLGAPAFSIAAERWRDASSTAVFDVRGKPTNLFFDYYLPWMQFVVAHEMLPDRATVLEHVPMLIAPVPDDAERNRNQEMAAYHDLIEQTYRFDRTPWLWVTPNDRGSADAPWLWEYLPNSGDYFQLAILPHTAGLAAATPQEADRPGGSNGSGRVRRLGRPVLSPEEFAKPEIQAALKRVARRNIRTDHAFAAAWQDSRFVAVNASENKPLPGQYAIRFENQPLASVYGELGVLKYLLGRCYNDRVVLHINGSPRIVRDGDPPLWSIDDTVIHFTAKSEPRLRVQPPEALVASKWDDESKRLSVRLRHAYAPVYDGPDRASTFREDGADIRARQRNYRLRGGPIEMELQW